MLHLTLNEHEVLVNNTLKCAVYNTENTMHSHYKYPVVNIG